MSISTYFHAFGLPKKIVALAFWDEMNDGGIQRGPSFACPLPLLRLSRTYGHGRTQEDHQKDAGA